MWTCRLSPQRSLLSVHSVSTITTLNYYCSDLFPKVWVLTEGIFVQRKPKHRKSSFNPKKLGVLKGLLMFLLCAVHVPRKTVSNMG